MPQYNRVVIVGVGLLGGSIGMALRARGLAKEIVGVGRSGRLPQEAIGLGAVDRVETDIQGAARNADLAVVCTPVRLVAESAANCAAVMHGDGLITDVGSTKATIVQAVEQAGLGCMFCGSHPLAGSHKSGASHGSATLFENKLVVVTPTPKTPGQLAERTEEFWRSIGARTSRMSPIEHDEALARTSHLPHVVAAALAAVTPIELLPLVGTGWRDTTRIAQGSASLWRQILEENSVPVQHALENFACSIDQWLSALRSGDGDRLEKLLESGKATRDALGS